MAAASIYKQAKQIVNWKPQPTVGFLNLPDEILTLILSIIASAPGSISTFASVHVTCKQLKAFTLIHPFYRNFKLTNLHFQRKILIRKKGGEPISASFLYFDYQGFGVLEKKYNLQLQCVQETSRLVGLYDKPVQTQMTSFPGKSLFAQVKDMQIYFMIFLKKERLILSRIESNRAKKKSLYALIFPML